MRITAKRDSINRMAVDLPELQAMLCCGKTAALRVARESNAGFNIGRRKLYNVERIREYMDRLTAGESANV